MNLPQRDPPGPIKKFERYFTIPVTQQLLEGLEKLKWRTQLDKTEVARRFLEYLLALPAESQDKLLESFKKQRQIERDALKEKRRALRAKKNKVTGTYKRSVGVVPEVKGELPQSEKIVAPTVMRVIRRSGLP